MKVQILYFNGCPNHESTARLAREVARELGLRVNLEEVEVTSAEDAVRLRFLGSPSVRVNGVDIELDAQGSSDYAFACRTYNGQGAPPREFLVKALNAASSVDPDTISCKDHGARDSKDLVNRRIGWSLS